MIFSIDNFISEQITRRDSSMCTGDIQENEDIINEQIKDRNILVIGGAGSIGSAFIKSILPYRPESLTVVDINENSLAELNRDLRSIDNIYIPNNFILYPIDYSDNVFSKLFLSSNGFDIIANFSAHKHVRSEKDIFSIEALLNNNVILLKKLLDLLLKHPPERFFCVSTDKATNPVNIMGASKKIMEDVVLSYSNEFLVSSARFANVAFSNGSLPAGFIERINKRQPIAAPNDIKRYFVSPKESGEICMLACILGKNNEIFFPKFEGSQMMTFSDIAEKLLFSFGYKPVQYKTAEEAIKASARIGQGNNEYPVFFSKSDTTGEKDFEEFYAEDETVVLNRFDSLGVIEKDKSICKDKLDLLFENLHDLFSKSNTTKDDIVRILQSYLPNFVHSEKEKNLDQKM